MAGYQRFVYYIYSYENGEKRTNVGFLRIEVRNGICKMTIQIRALSQTQPLKIYLFKRDRQRLNCYEVGSLPVQSGVGNIILSYAMDELADASLSLTELGGMILFSSREKFYATTWDDDGIIIDEMVVMNQEDKSTPTENQEPVDEIVEPVENAEQEETIRQDENIPQNSSVEQNEHISQNNNMEQQQNRAQENNIEQQQDRPLENNIEQRRDRPRDNNTEQRHGRPQNSNMHQRQRFLQNLNTEQSQGITQLPNIRQTGSINQDIQVQCLAEEPSLDYATKLLSTYPKMYPFEGDSVLDCVRIELQDIHELPIEYWSLAHNSFLMQGYYSYLHLIFALVKNKDAQNSYIIGIPGICHARQHYLAGLFGFQRFMPIRITNDINGEFGYWVCELSKINA